MQVMLDTSSLDDRDPALLRALSKFLEAVAALYEPAKDAEPSINGKSDMPIELKPDFKPSDSLPPDNVDKGAALIPLSIPLPPNVIPIAGTSSFVSTLPPPALVAALSADRLPPMPLPPGPAPAPEFDSAGVVYDANLHSSTKSKTIDGKWKARRNRGGAQVPAGTTNGTLSIQGVKIEPGQEAAAIAKYVADNATPIPLPPTGIPAPPASVAPQADDDIEIEADAPAAAPGMDFPTFISLITAGMNAGTVSQAKITEVMAAHKLDSLFSLNTKPDLVSVVARDFGFA